MSIPITRRISIWDVLVHYFPTPTAPPLPILNRPPTPPSPAINDRDADAEEAHIHQVRFRSLPTLIEPSFPDWETPSHFHSPPIHRINLTPPSPPASSLALSTSPYAPSFNSETSSHFSQYISAPEYPNKKPFSFAPDVKKPPPLSKPRSWEDLEHAISRNSNTHPLVSPAPTGTKEEAPSVDLKPKIFFS